MNLNHHIRSLSLQEREKLAKKVDTSGAYLSRIAYGNGRPGHKLARKLSVETGIPLADCRPDIWGEGPEAATNNSMEAREDLVNQ
ncbi:hypothetical protein [Microbulbifer sp. 2205BS26-8]|uniref:hypothetical protein n=1 Tax=Microbulbifer sp. 2205BS26-8 TaxID=3064386 RepID=UPI00273EA8DA|nr:hypothetical protein [Microbulbifer sp. 2205BS26-8]MDP5210972.1 hypothetical protein [Microbulbifer sp. 2205BS26-8]